MEKITCAIKCPICDNKLITHNANSKKQEKDWYCHNCKTNINVHFGRNNNDKAFTYNYMKSDVLVTHYINLCNKKNNEELFKKYSILSHLREDFLSLRKQWKNG